jgi:hypothetical protein
MPRWRKRGIDITVGIAAGVISLPTLWLCYWFFIKPLPTGTEGVAPWALMGGLAPLVAGVAVYGAQLLVPELRVQGARVRRRPMLIALAILCAFLASLGFWRGTANTIAVSLVTLVMLGGVVRGAILSPPSDGHE